MDSMGLETQTALRTVHTPAGNKVVVNPEIDSIYDKLSERVKSLLQLEGVRELLRTGGERFNNRAYANNSLDTCRAYTEAHHAIYGDEGIIKNEG